MFIVTKCIDSPNIDPIMGEILRSSALGFSAVALIIYSQIPDGSWQKEKSETSMHSDFLTDVISGNLAISEKISLLLKTTNYWFYANL